MQLTPTTSPQITRSVGVYAGAGCIAGGGYQGATTELDAAVALAAEALAKRYAQPVEIRFNSHRLSGGAFMAFDDRGDVGVSARAPDTKQPIGFRVYIGAGSLRDPATANSFLSDAARSYYWAEAASLDDALDQISRLARIT